MLLCLSPARLPCRLGPEPQAPGPLGSPEQARRSPALSSRSLLFLIKQDTCKCHYRNKEKGSRLPARQLSTHAPRALQTPNRRASPEATRGTPPAGREVAFLRAAPRAPGGSQNAPRTRPVCEPHPQQLPVAAHEDAHEVLAVPPLGQGQVAAVPGKADSCRGEGRARVRQAQREPQGGSSGKNGRKQRSEGAGAPGHPHGGRSGQSRF